MSKSNKKRSAVPTRHRLKLLIEAFEKNNCFICYICRRKFCDVEYASIDHVRPLSVSGENGIDNLVIACLPCNLAKNNLSLSQVETLIEWNVWETIRKPHIVLPYECHQDSLSDRNAAKVIAGLRERLKKTRR